MVFFIDEEFPKKLYPLAWLVGEWKGFGVFKYEGKSFKVDPIEVDQTVIFSYFHQKLSSNQQSCNRFPML